MNNLVLGFTILVSAATVCLIERGMQQRIQAQTSVSSEQLLSAQSSLKEGHSTTLDLKQQLLQQEHAIENYRSELKAAQQEVATVSTPELNPAREGAWPQEQPYFYMAKRRLGDVKYEAITDGDKISKAAVALFSITPQEKTAMQTALQNFRNSLSNLESQHAEKLTPARKDDETYKELSFRLQPMTNEIAGLRQQFGDSVRTALGMERGDFFMGRANDWFEDQDSRTGDRGGTVTLTAELQADGKVQHFFKYKKASGGNGSMGVTYPLYVGSPVMRYKHLFGEEPLIKESPKK